MSEARAFWVTAPGRGEIRVEALPEVEAGQVRVRTLYSGISRGTESLVFRGEVPASEWRRMRAPHQRGEFPAPVKYGYASVGIVEVGPHDLIGRNVFCLHPHQDRYVVPRDAVHVVPPEVAVRRAVLAANLETAINGLWDARPAIGDRVAVIGAGTVGCLAAWLVARIPGAHVELVDLDPGKAAIAGALGVAYVAPDAAAADADLVIHASGAPAGLVTALGLAGYEATIVELSWYGTRTVELPLGAAFHARRLKLISSQVGDVPEARRARWTRERRLALALDLLRAPALDALISAEDDFDALPEVMTRLAAQGARGTLCHVVRYGHGRSG